MATVLIVDDVEDNRHLLQQDLEDEGYTVTEAVDGMDALEAVEKQMPDAILMDINMPRMNGIEACRKLKECSESRLVPIIMLSARGQDDDIVAALNAGAQDYVTKPYVVEVLLARVRAAVSVKAACDRIEHVNVRLKELYDTAYQFVDNVSHEFRTPLTVIKEFASIVRDGIAGPVNEEQRDYLGIIIDRVGDLALMVDDMLDISKLEAGLIGMRRKPCGICEIIDPVRDGLQRKAATCKVTVRIEIDPELPRVYCDAEKAGRVILNLAVNAIKFSPEGAVVRIWARADGNGVTVGVTDLGPGIDQEGLAVLFERFRQLDTGVRSSTKGFGLGLNIARELVNLNFGQLAVASEIGKGSTFSFTLPLTNPPEVLGRYLDWLTRQRKGDSVVSLVRVKPRIPCELEGLGVIGEALRGLLRHPDIALEAAGGEWMALIGQADVPLEDVVECLQSEWCEMSHDVLTFSLPEVKFEPIGTWQLPGQRDAFCDRCLSVLNHLETQRA